MPGAMNAHLTASFFDPTKCYIGGRWVAPAGGEYLDIENPSDGTVIGQIPRGKKADIDAAVAAAEAALKGEWGKMTAADRGRILTRIGRLVLERADELARWCERMTRLYRDTAMLERMAKTLLAKVESATELLRQSRARVSSLNASSAKQKAQIKQFEETIASLEAMVETQRTEIAALTQRVDSLRVANVAVTGERDSARDTVSALRKDANTVYYVVGTKDDLKKRGIIVEEGSKFLVFGRKALVPARKLDTTAFTAIDKWTNTEIALTAQKFRVISRHDASLIDAPRTPDGKVAGNLRITDPGQFWTTSKYLIIVEN